MSVFDPLTGVIGGSSHLWGYSGLVLGNQRRTEGELKRRDKSGSSSYGHGEGNVLTGLGVRLKKEGKKIGQKAFGVRRQWVSLKCNRHGSEESFIYLSFSVGSKLGRIRQRIY